ncbi:MAG: hypothetical protein O7G84_01080 [Gammaproteobacteria bacterium]|nr:hypothetical protein [Gammaproteobacteria bacterium]
MPIDFTVTLDLIKYTFTVEELRRCERSVSQVLAERHDRALLRVLFPHPPETV